MELTTIQFFHGATRKLLDVERGVTNPWNGIEEQQYKNSNILCAVIATDYYRGDTITGKPVVFLRPTRLRILTGRRQTIWLFRVTVRSWTWDYREQIQQAFRAGIELAFSGLQFKHSITAPQKATRTTRLQSPVRVMRNSCSIFFFSPLLLFLSPDFFSDFSHRWSHTSKTHSSVEVLRHGQVWFLAL